VLIKYGAPQEANLAVLLTASPRLCGAGSSLGDIAYTAIIVRFVLTAIRLRRAYQRRSQGKVSGTWLCSIIQHEPDIGVSWLSHYLVKADGFLVLRLRLSSRFTDHTQYHNLKQMQVLCTEIITMKDFRFSMGIFAIDKKGTRFKAP
jgi:hypothetical protein